MQATLHPKMIPLRSPSHLGCRISCPAEVVGAFAWWDGVEDADEPVLSCFNGSFHRAPHQVFYFGEDLLDRIQVRAVGRQKHQMRARVTDHVTLRFPLWLPRLSRTTMSPGFRVLRSSFLT